MLGRLLNRYNTALYIQIWEQRIKITDFTSGKVFEGKPLLAIDTSSGIKVVKAVGSAAILETGGNIDIVNPFSHPRSLLADFAIAEKLLRYLFKKLSDSRLFRPAPAVVIHPMEKLEGGLTDVEIRAFSELALGAGAREVFVHQEGELNIHNCDYQAYKQARSQSK